MDKNGAKRGDKLSVTLDGDKLGQIAGATVALVVMAMCFYYQKVDGYTAATRVGWAFVLSYAAVFFLVRVILRTTLFEFIAHRDAELAARRVRRRASTARDDVPEPDVGVVESPEDEVT